MNSHLILLKTLSHAVDFDNTYLTHDERQNLKRYVNANIVYNIIIPYLRLLLALIEGGINQKSFSCK